MFLSSYISVCINIKLEVIHHDLIDLQHKLNDLYNFK